MTEKFEKAKPEFWFDKDGRIWFGHECDGLDGSFYREYTLPRSIYSVVQAEPVTIMPPVSCGRCKIRGTILDGEFVESNTPASE